MKTIHYFTDNQSHFAIITNSKGKISAHKVFNMHHAALLAGEHKAKPVNFHYIHPTNNEV